MTSGVCLSHNVLKGTKITHCFFKLDVLPSSQEMLRGFYSMGFLRMASSQHLGVHEVVIYYVIVMNKEVYKLQALGM